MATSAAVTAVIELTQELLSSLDTLLIRMDFAVVEVYGFEAAIQAVDFDGRCERLRRLCWKPLLSSCCTSTTTSSSSDEELLASLHAFDPLLHQLSSFLQALKDAKVAPHLQWDKWWSTGKYARQLGQLSDQLNNLTVNHALALWAAVDRDHKDTCFSFPPTLEQLKLCPPSTLKQQHVNVHLRLPLLPVLPSNSGCQCQAVEALSTSTRSTTSTASTASMDSLSSSESSTSSSSSTDESAPTATTNTTASSQQEWTWTSTTTVPQKHSSAPQQPLCWDWSPRDQKDKEVLSATARTELYVKTQHLLAIDQSVPVKEMRIVLAQLEPGDTTSRTIGAAKAAMMTMTMVTALFSNDPLMQTTREAAAIFTHYLLEFTLENGTMGTLENCVQDVYLYAGRTPRPQRHCVATIPLRPGAVGAPPLTSPLCLRDLIQFRNDQRQLPYNLWDNNCKHFVYKAIWSGQLFPKPPPTYNNPHTERVPDTSSSSVDQDEESFFNLCQAKYVQQDTFVIFG